MNAADVDASGAPTAETPAADTFHAQWRRGSAKRAAATSAASAPLSAAQRREKHRMFVRRSYYQKKELKLQLKQEIARLEKQYKALVAQQQQEALAGDERDAETRRELDLLVCVCCEGSPCTRVLYREAVALKEQLHSQHDALEEQIHQHLRFRDKLALFAAQQLEDADESTTRAPTKSPPAARSKRRGATSQLDDALQLETDRRFLGFRTLDEDECNRTVLAMQHDIVSQRGAPSFREIGPPILGWTRKRTLGSAAKFSIAKCFEAESSTELADRAWRVYTESPLFAQLYSGVMNMRFQLLQRVSEDNALFYRSLRTEMLKVRCGTFFQLSRVRMDGRLVIVFCSLDPSRIVADAGSAYTWLDMFSWLSFSDHEDADGARGCEIEFGGNMPSVTVAETEFWMVELLSYLLRFESRLVRPAFSVA